MNSRRRRIAFAASLAWLSPLAAARDSGDPFKGPGMPYDAFDKLPATHVMVGGADLAIGFAPGTFDLSQAVIVEWVATSAAVVAAFYDGFPVRHARILIVAADGNRVRSGMAFAYRGAALRIVLGRATTPATLADDWILIHELTHLAFPNVVRAHHWIEEGLASYIEPIARARAGKLSASGVWRQFVEGMPKGLPEADDRGLDFTPTWGRTYWGGALFCLLADIEIRKQTRNRFGLQDALRAIVAAGGNLEADWPLKRALERGDAAVGVPVLADLYARMKETPVATDLPLLWRQLGIGSAGGVMSFDDAAPLGPIRRAITKPAIADDARS